LPRAKPFAVPAEDQGVPVKQRFQVDKVRALLLGGLIAVSCAFLPDLVLAQGNPPPAATPIGKIVTVKGWVKVEHVIAVVGVQVSVGSAQARVGDLVYEGDVVSTGADGAVGITFNDGAEFNLASNLSMITSNSSLFSLTSTRPKAFPFARNPQNWIERLSDEELRVASSTLRAIGGVSRAGLGAACDRLGAFAALNASPCW
jgi:hypothetical protein